MSDVENLLQAARKHYERADLYGYFSGNNDRLTTAQVALDTAEDAMLALSHYEMKGIGSDNGEKYLRLYGFLQAAFLQQDAIRELHRLFVGNFTEPTGTSAWKQLRELRNLTVGHPVEKGRGKEPRKRTFITQVSLETDGFDYQVWHQGTGKTSFETAGLSTLYAGYKKEAASFLREILTGLSRAPDISCSS